MAAATQHQSPQAIMVHHICFDDTADAAPPVTDTTDNGNSEQAAARKSSSSSGDDAPLSRKQQQQQHGIKNKSVKKTTVSKQRPRNHDERDALKMPGADPTILLTSAYHRDNPRRRQASQLTLNSFPGMVQNLGQLPTPLCCV
jgi:hypothetical protein